MAIPQLLLRLGKSRGGLLAPRRALSYPRQPLTEPVPGLAGQSGPSRPVGRARGKEETRITRLENGLRVASQEAFGQHSTIGGTYVRSCECAVCETGRTNVGAFQLETRRFLFTLVLVDAGSRYEVDYTAGVSHFLQKLAFQVC